LSVLVVAFNNIYSISVGLFSSCQLRIVSIRIFLPFFQLALSLVCGLCDCGHVASVVNIVPKHSSPWHSSYYPQWVGMCSVSFKWYCWSYNHLVVYTTCPGGSLWGHQLWSTVHAKHAPNAAMYLLRLSFQPIMSV